MSLRIKITIAIVFAFLSFLLLSLVAPKSDAYDETAFSSVSQGMTPIQALELGRSLDKSYFDRYDTSNYLISVTNPQFGGFRDVVIYFVPADTTNIKFADYVNNNEWLQSNITCRYFQYRYEFRYDEYRVSSSGASSDYIELEKAKMSANYGNLWTNRCSLTFASGTINPSPIQTFKDGYLVTPRGWTFSYYVCPLPTSEHIAWYYQTRRYIARISATYNGQPITLDIPNYLSWSPSTKLSPLVEPFAKDDNGALTPVFQLTTTSAESSVEPYFRNVMYYKFDTDADKLTTPTMSTPDVEYSSDNSSHWVDSSSTGMSISLYNLLQAFRKAYPDNTFADNWLYQDLSLSFIGYDDNKTYYTQVLRYSVVSDRTEPPPNVNTNQPDWSLDDRDTIINNINNDKTYDYLTMLPNSYLPPRTLESPDYSDLSTVPTPSYNFTPISLDGEDMDFWHWLVNYIYDTPALSIVFISALGFLVCKVVIH